MSSMVPTLKPGPLPRPGQRSRLATAAASKDPYGLAPNNRAGALGAGGTSPRTYPLAAGGGAPPDGRLSTAATSPTVATQGLPPGSAPGLRSQPQNLGGAPKTSPYDLSTDPGYQQISSMLGMNDEQARASALKQREQLLLGYGDANLAKAVLGDQTWADAAGKNPTSTLAQLLQQHTRAETDLGNTLNANNLDYSGYRVSQEQQAAQDYQNALAQAAAGVNSQLGSIGDQLTQALQGTQQQRIQAIQDAAARAAQAAAAAGVDPGASTPPTTLLGHAGPALSTSALAKALAKVPAGRTVPLGNAKLKAGRL